MVKSIDETEIVIFDTETTGLDPQGGDRIVEIAGVRFRGKEKLATFHSLVDPEREICEAAFKVNKISQNMLRGAPKIKEVMPGFLKFIKGSCLCSYNAGFDLGFLDNELKIIGQGPLEDVVVVDVLKMARRLLPNQERYALWFIAERLGIKNKQEHRAFSDVEMTYDVFHRLKDILQSKGILDYISFTRLFSINPHLLENILAQRLSEIQEAISLGVKIKIRYLSSSGVEVTEREVMPKEIRQENNQSYLVGFCSLRNDERTFRIDGILHLEVL